MKIFSNIYKLKLFYQIKIRHFNHGKNSFSYITYKMLYHANYKVLYHAKIILALTWNFFAMIFFIVVGNEKYILIIEL